MGLEEEKRISVEKSEFTNLDLSTHILDISGGKPAPDVNVQLFRKLSGRLVLIGTGKTDKDGRIKSWKAEEGKINIIPEERKTPGTYALVFAVKEHFDRQGQKTIFPNVNVEFIIEDNSHYHIPIVVSPYGYSTYRGS